MQRNKTTRRQQKEPLLANSLPTRPWQYIAVDMFEFDRQMHLITADSYSGWFEIDHLPNTKATTVIKKFKMHISRYGIPDKILRDSGPQFANQYFKRFTAQYGIEHKTSSPGYSGKATDTPKELSKQQRMSYTQPRIATRTPTWHKWLTATHRERSS